MPVRPIGKKKLPKLILFFTVILGEYIQTLSVSNTSSNFPIPFVIYVAKVFYFPHTAK